MFETLYAIVSVKLHFHIFLDLFLSIFISIMSLFARPKPDIESNNAAASTVYMLEQDICIYEQKLINLISYANDARNSSDPKVLVSLSKNLEEAGYAFLDTNHALFAARKRAGFVSAEELEESKYHDLHQRQISGMRLLQN